MIFKKEFCIPLVFLISLYCVNGLNLDRIGSRADTLVCYCSGSGSECTSDTIACNGATDECYALFEDSKLKKRGCSTSLNTEEKAKCDDDEDKSCLLCIGDKCNHIRESFKCASCSTENNENCLNDLANVQTETCETASESPGKCFTSVNGDITTRGCLNTASAIEQCEGDSTKCSSCLANGQQPCNTNEFPIGRRKCIHCTDSDSLNCKSINNPTLKYCKSPDDQCATIHSEGKVKQLCASDLSTNEKQNCEENKASCLLCKSNECNKAELKKCYSCSGEQCKRTSSKDVTTNCASDDPCVALFDGFSLLKRGCYSELETEEKTKCDSSTDKSCYKCESEMCNDVSREDHTCLTCSSESDINCLQDLSKITPARCPLVIGADHLCFVEVSDTSILRGCLDSGNAIKKCEASPEQCSTCSIDSTKPCNAYEFPVGRRKCIQCIDSDTNKCAQIANPTSKYCNSPNDQCVTINKSGNIKQLCAKDLSVEEERDCDDKKAACLICESNNCNKANLKECYSCSGEQCQRTSNQLATTNCAADDFCAAVFDGFTLSKRGCYSELTAQEKTKCDSESDKSCYKCSDERCNDLMRTDHICVSCSSKTDRNCLDDVTKSFVLRCPLVVGGESKCVVAIEDDKSITRGCLKSGSEIKRCEQNPTSCSSCLVSSTGPCNTYEFPQNRRKCLHCVSSEDNDCISPIQLNSKYCTDPEDQCIVVKNEAKVKQSCAADLTEDETTSCRDGKSTCLKCDSNDCNKAEIIACYSCSGDECQRTSHQKDIKACDTCVAIFDNFSLVKRGCYADILTEEKEICDDPKNTACYKCDTEKCNYLGRVEHKCLTCSTDNDGNCLEDPSKISSVRCPIVIGTESRCYVSATDTTTERGCLQTASEIKVCEQNENLCSTCAVDINNSCNSYEFPLNRRKCIHCNGKDCGTAESSLSRYCNAPNDTCVTVNNGNNIIKTCARKLTTVENDFCIENEKSCSFCESNNCNESKSESSSGTGGTNVLIIIVPIILAIIIIGILGFIFIRKR